MSAEQLRTTLRLHSVGSVGTRAWPLLLRAIMIDDCADCAGIEVTKLCDAITVAEATREGKVTCLGALDADEGPPVACILVNLARMPAALILCAELAECPS